MLLRRVMEHLRHQHWTAVGIDLVIVVLGVFIGMQVSNWNQARVDAKRGHEYVERLRADMEDDLGARQGMVSYYTAVLESVERTDALLADPLSPPKDLLVQAYRATEVIYSPQSRTTWDEVVSAGDTGLLPARFAGGAAAYFADDIARASFETLWTSPYRLRVRNLIPLGVQKALRAGCSDARDERQRIVGFMPGCDLDLPDAVIATTAAALRADPVVQQSLRYQYSEVYSATQNIQGDVTKLKGALATLDRKPASARE